jgi:hypothetical protein
MSKRSEARLVDTMIGAYLDWREACRLVHDAYRSWTSSEFMDADAGDSSAASLSWSWSTLRRAGGAPPKAAPISASEAVGQPRSGRPESATALDLEGVQQVVADHFARGRDTRRNLRRVGVHDPSLMALPGGRDPDWWSKSSELLRSAQFSTLDTVHGRFAAVTGCTDWRACDAGAPIR